MDLPKRENDVKLIEELGWGSPCDGSKLNGKQHVVTTFQIWTGAKVIRAAVDCMSMSNAQDRHNVRAVANEMLRLCDEGES